MIYVCIKEFTDVHFKVTIEVGQKTRLYEYNENMDYVQMDLVELRNITYPARFFFGHFKALNEIRYQKLEEILNI